MTKKLTPEIKPDRFSPRFLAATGIAIVAFAAALALTIHTPSQANAAGNKNNSDASHQHQAEPAQIHYRTVEIEGQSIFYREAGPKDAPTVLLLHGFPTSSHMFRNLIPALADRYHVVAPD